MSTTRKVAARIGDAHRRVALAVRSATGAVAAAVGEGAVGVGLRASSETSALPSASEAPYQPALSGSARPSALRPACRRRLPSHRADADRRHVELAPRAVRALTKPFQARS
jgi:hypothetical protein